MKLPNLSDEVIVHSRPRAETDWRCPRDRYWTYEYEGKGLESDEESVQMFLGTSIHDGTAAIALMTRDTGSADIDLIANTARQQVSETLLSNTAGTAQKVEEFAGEQSALVEGLLRGFYRWVWPRMLVRYPKIVAIETDVSLRHDEYGNPNPAGNWEFLAKPDLILQTEDESEIVYWEYKSTSSKKDKWINSWKRAVQVHATMGAINATLGIDLTSTIVQGFYKGYESYGKLSSPMCYAYHRWGNPPFTQTETVYEYKNGYRRTPTWLLEGGVKKWVDEMPDQVLTEQFPEVPPIFPNPDHIRTFLSQRATREYEIRMSRELLLDPALDAASKTVILNNVFPQHYNACEPAWGFDCPRLHLCFGDGVPNDPTYRKPHHKREVELLQITKPEVTK